MTMIKVSKSLRVGLFAAAIALSGATASAIAQEAGDMSGMDMQGNMPGMGNTQGMAAAPDAGGAPAMGSMQAQGQGMAAMQGGMMPMMMGMMPMMGMPAANMGGAVAAPAAPANSELDQKVDELSQVIASLVERIDRMEAEAGRAVSPEASQ